MLLVLMLPFLFACSPKQDGRADPAADSVVATARASSFTPAQFALLKWVEGDWQGRLPDGGFFFERYRVADDSTILMYGFPDSTFTTPNDTSRFTLRAGQLRNESASASWIAAKVDSMSAEFEPEWGATSRFVWQRGKDGWTSTLYGSSDSAGSVYLLKRPYQWRVVEPQ